MKDTEQIGRKGIAAVQQIFLDMGWIFREQPISDFGVDAQAEVKHGGQGTGRLIALQIKSGASWFKTRGSNYVYHGEKRHLEYWTNHSLPVFLILHDPDKKLTLWQKVDPSLIVDGENGAWSIEIPPTNVLDASADAYLQRGAASDPASMRRLRMAIDQPLIEQFVEWAKSGPVFMSIEEWVNKTLNMRTVRVMIGAPGSAPVLRLEPWMPVDDIDAYMAYMFPWLGYDYADDLEKDPVEIQLHVFEVEPNGLALSFLALESYFRDGASKFEAEATYEDDGVTYSEDGEPFDEAGFRRAVERDPFG